MTTHSSHATVNACVSALLVVETTQQCHSPEELSCKNVDPVNVFFSFPPVCVMPNEGPFSSSIVDKFLHKRLDANLELSFVR